MKTFIVVLVFAVLSVGCGGRQSEQSEYAYNVTLVVSYMNGEVDTVSTRVIATSGQMVASFQQRYLFQKGPVDCVEIHYRIWGGGRSWHKIACGVRSYKNLQIEMVKEVNQQNLRHKIKWMKGSVMLLFFFVVFLLIKFW